MTALKKIGLLFVLVITAALNVFVYWNSWFYDRAQKQENDERKVAYLEASNTFCPLNDRVFYELGKSHLDLGLQNLGDPEKAGAHFRKAVQSLERSITINPSSPYAHFHLGQALLQLEFFSPSNGSRFIEEYKKAVLLAGEDSQVYGETGRLFLSRWQRLSEDDRRFTLDLMRRILAGKDLEQIAGLLGIWEMNVGDFGLLESVLPADPQVYRTLAEYLGERSLSFPDRHRFLAKAELIEFGRARRELQAGEYALYRYELPEARHHLGLARSLLEGIRFYQTLSGERLIAGPDYDDLSRAVRLAQAKCRIEEGGKLEDALADLNRYLALEDRPREVAALETYLRGRGVLADRPEADFDDLGRLAFELFLQFKQTRYRDIISLGRTLQKSLVIVPEAKKKDYAEVLHLIGDSFQKVDFLYDAGETYRRALELEPGSPETLLRLRANYARLNDERRARETEEAVGKVMAPRTAALGGHAVLKGRTFSRTLIFDGGKVSLDVQLRGARTSLSPAVAVFFNGRVVREEPLAEDVISLTLETVPGTNLIQVTPLNTAIALETITWRPLGDEAG
ncbi:MAG: hypothetical protein WAU81_11250 [Candidatus Aminicenantales bacterium]